MAWPELGVPRQRPVHIARTIEPLLDDYNASDGKVKGACLPCFMTSQPCEEPTPPSHHAELSRCQVDNDGSVPSGASSASHASEQAELATPHQRDSANGGSMTVDHPRARRGEASHLVARQHVLERGEKSRKVCRYECVACEQRQRRSFRRTMRSRDDATFAS
jgi:hypothetical protein